MAWFNQIVILSTLLPWQGHLSTAALGQEQVERAHTYTHTLLSFATISTVLLAFSLTVLILPGRPP